MTRRGIESILWALGFLHHRVRQIFFLIAGLVIVGGGEEDQQHTREVRPGAVYSSLHVHL